MHVYETTLPGVLIIEPKVYGDSRGFFFETFQSEKYQQAGLTKPFVQDNISRSSKGVLRGLHYQLEKPQAKLVSVFQGAVLDVAVDVRQGSPHFGKWVAVELNDTNHRQLFIPEGFAHGFVVLSDTADFFYKCSDYYHPASECGVQWNDPKIGIDWNIENPHLSEKDLLYPPLHAVPTHQLPSYQG